jgi:hypothetical protein
MNYSRIDRLTHKWRRNARSRFHFRAAANRQRNARNASAQTSRTGETPAGAKTFLTTERGSVMPGRGSVRSNVQTP